MFTMLDYNSLCNSSAPNLFWFCMNTNIYTTYSW